ncbi:MAG TPA: biotin/lipoyl-binding protein [Gammaproteobacteria bacterium]|nr:biotin/lipoyl-binding protein [Gammaproteobacteria bacterium]
MSRPLLLAMSALALAACGGDGTGLPAVGTLERDRIEIVAEARETLLEVAVREGEEVATGDLLARQDDARLQTAVAHAQAVRTRAARRVDELVRGPRREAIAEAQAGLDGARNRRVVEQREYERVEELVERGLLSATELDGAQLRRDSAAAELRQWEARVEALLEGTTVEELDQAAAALAEAEARLADARLAVERLTLRAPRAGVVEAIPYKRGDRPPPGAVVIVMLVDEAPYARVHLPQAVRAGVRIGMTAAVRVDGFERAFAGELRAVAAEAAFTPYFALTERDRGRLSYPAEVVLTEAAARELPTGLPVEVDFPDLVPQ